MRTTNKHDRYVTKLKKQLCDEYDSVHTHVPLLSSKNNKVIRAGEIDLLCYKGDAIDVYEVKCSHRIVKARKQLHRIRKLFDTPQVRTFFYCGSSGLLMSV